MKQIYIDYIAAHLAVKPWQVENCITLLEDGCTIPFISRYRKEKTGGLDDVAVAEVSHWAEVFTEMEKRKETILGTISEAGKLTPELRRRIEETVSASELEDLYLPYRPKRKTRASVAVEKGLEPLADALWNAALRAPSVEARKYVGDKVPTVEEALAGARDIVAERLSETASVRESLRESFRTRRVVTKVTKAGADHPDAGKYRSYFNFTMPVAKIPAHNLLAILRAADEGILNVGLDTDAEKCTAKLFYEFFKGRRYPSEETGNELKAAFSDSFKRLLEPSISGEILREAKRKADVESVGIFGENLRQLLLAPPVGGKRTMAIDPGFRTGCKVVCLDERGALLHFEAIFPHPPVTRKIESITAIGKMVEQYRPEVIAVGSGTAGRETADFLKRCYLPEGVKVYMVSEDGASVYSASETGREEFPDYDVTVRGAVSIGRRLQDPLAELVKIDPKSLGIGQYQHDVDQALLKEKLDNTVLICVNSVGVNLNTASEYLLRYVSGIGPALAKNIVAYRDKIGGFTSRRQLLEVPRLGAKAFEQCAGFLRIPGAENPLDGSAVHPECYHIVDRMARDLGVGTAALVGNADLCKRLKAEDYVEGEFGLPTVRDILQELAKPGRDPREEAQDFAFAEDIRTIDDLKVGMELPGIVTNITAFGAFVDIGIHEQGLIHVSKMGARGHVDPSKVVRLHQKVTVTVLDVDLDRNRISLGLMPAAGRQAPGEGGGGEMVR
jgi:uncharacterized protein